MINLPDQTKQWKQANNSDLYGNISQTKNINFDNEGYLRLSNSSRAAMHSSIDAKFDNIASITYNFDYDYFINTWDAAFAGSPAILSAYPTLITTGGVPATDLEGDSIINNNLLIVSQDTDVDYYNLTANTWTDTDITLTSGGQHPIVSMLSIANGVAIANKNTVGLYASPLTATTTLITTLTIPTEFEITQMVYFNQNLYIGTREVNEGNAYMFVWNGSGSAAQQAYKLDCQMVISLCVHKGTIVLLSSQGELLAFNGASFTHLDAFPIFYTDYVLNIAGIKSMYKNIMRSNGDVIYILFSNNANVTHRLVNQPDGLWCYDEKVGLYHKYSLSNSLVNIQTITTASVNITTNQITVASPAHPTGTEVYFVESFATPIGGLTDDTKYFVIKVDATHIQLATTKANAIAGTAIDLTSTGDSGQTLNFFPNIDYGSYFTAKTTDITIIDRPSFTPQYGTDLIWGGGVDLRQLTGDKAFMGTVTPGVESRGYFITPKVFSNEVTDTFNLLTLKYSPFKSELDKIIVKYRVTDDRLEEINQYYWGITWTSTNTFTTTDAHYADAVVGNEIEVLRGAAGGLLAHIVTIVNNAGTYTVTIDETFDAYITGDVSTAVFRNWIKFTTIDSSNTDGFISKQLDAKGKFIQLKIELRGLQTKIEEVKIDNKYLLPAKK